MSQYDGLLFSSSKTKVEVNPDGGSTWYVLTGVSGITSSGGDPTVNTVSDFHGTSQEVGAPEPPTVEITFSRFAPTTKIYRLLMDARDDQDNIQFRWSLPEKLIHKTATTARAAIATNGTVTLSGSGSGSAESLFTEKRFAPGIALKIGSNYHLVNTIAADGALTIDPAPSGAVAAAAYDVYLPPIKQPEFSGRIGSFGNVSLESEAALSTTMTLIPSDLLSKITAG